MGFFDTLANLPGKVGQTLSNATNPSSLLKLKQVSQALEQQKRANEIAKQKQSEAFAASLAKAKVKNTTISKPTGKEEAADSQTGEKADVFSKVRDTLLNLQTQRIRGSLPDALYSGAIEGATNTGREVVKAANDPNIQNAGKAVTNLFSGRQSNPQDVGKGVLPTTASGLNIGMQYPSAVLSRALEALSSDKSNLAPVAKGVEGVFNKMGELGQDARRFYSGRATPGEFIVEPGTAIRSVIGQEQADKLGEVVDLGGQTALGAAVGLSAKTGAKGMKGIYDIAKTPEARAALMSSLEKSYLPTKNTMMSGGNPIEPILNLTKAVKAAKDALPKKDKNLPVLSPITSDMVMNDHADNILTQIEQSTAGKKMFIPSTEPGVVHDIVGQKSTFPDWVPPDLRSKPLFDDVLKLIASGEVPTKGKSRMDLYKIIHDKISDGIQKAPDKNTVDSILDFDSLSKSEPTRAGQGGEEAYNNFMKRQRESATATEASKNDVRDATLRDQQIAGSGVKGYVVNKLFPEKQLPEPIQRAFDKRAKDLAVAKSEGNIAADKLDTVVDRLIPNASSLSTGKLRTERSRVGDLFIDFIQHPDKETAAKHGFDFSTALDIVKELRKNNIDPIREQARATGVEVGDVPNYFPGIYADGAKELMKVMKSQGVGTVPFFAKNKTIPDYRTAESMGLTKKYSHPAPYIGELVMEAGKAKANKEFYNSLIEEKLLLPGERVRGSEFGNDWKHPNVPGIPADMMAPPNIANFLEKAFNKEGDALLQFTGDANKSVQDIILAGGFKGINSYVTLQANNALMMGRPKVLKDIARATLRGSEVNMAKHKEPQNRLADRELAELGQVISSSADFEKQYLNTPKHQGTANGTVKEKLLNTGKQVLDKGKWTWDNIFQNSAKSTFGDVMPSTIRDMYIDLRDAAVKKGMPYEEAKKLAGDTVGKTFNMKDPNASGRSVNMQNLLNTLFLAPRFKEAMISTLGNAIKSVSTEIKNPAYKMNRRLITGAVMTFAIMNAAQLKLTGNLMINNPGGKWGSLLVPRGDGTYWELEWMPGMKSIPTALAKAGNAAAHIDPAGVVKALSSFSSVLGQVGSDLGTNTDFSGKPVYQTADNVGKGETATVQGAAGDIGKYLFGKVNHPYILGASKMLNGEDPIKSGLKALELPLKIFTGSKTTGDAKVGVDTALKVKQIKADVLALQQQGDIPGNAAKIEAKSKELDDLLNSLTPEQADNTALALKGKMELAGPEIDALQNVEKQTQASSTQAVVNSREAYDNYAKALEAAKSGDIESAKKYKKIAVEKAKGLSPYDFKNGLIYLIKGQRYNSAEEQQKALDTAEAIFK